MNKKIMITIIAVIAVLLVVISTTAAIKMNNPVFQSEEEMSEIINGKWMSGNTDFDFIITIQGDSMMMEVVNGAREPEEYHIVLVPKKGYFYTDTNTDNLYKPVMQNGRYVIKTDKWTYEKVE